MSVDYNTAVETSRLQQVVTAIDAGAGNGAMRLLDSSGNILSTLPLSKPCATVASGLLTFSGLSLIDPAAALDGTASAARFEDSIGTVVISGLTVGTVGSTSEILLSPTNIIVAGQTVAITAATIQGN